jgi:2-keto-4-pentenoate hydratase
MISQHSIARATEKLVEQRERVSRYEPVIEEGRMLSVDDAYLVQKSFVGALSRIGGGAIRGYKIGWTNQAAQARYGLTDPVVGVVHERWIMHDGARVALSDYANLGIECEIVIVLGADISSDAAEVSWNQVASVHAGFELIDNRGAHPDLLDAGSMIAHNAWNASIVVGPGLEVGPGFLGYSPSGALFRNEELVARTDETPVLGGPLGAVSWLAGYIGRIGHSLKRGDHIMTGSLIGPLFKTGVAEYRFDAKGLPSVSVEIVS